MGKCPPHGKTDHALAWVIRNNKKEMVVVDKTGNAFKTYGEGYDAYSSEPLQENKIDPSEYKFDRYFTSFDF